jgi:SAM-dependent methyltransferase
MKYLFTFALLIAFGLVSLRGPAFARAEGLELRRGRQGIGPTALRGENPSDPGNKTSISSSDVLPILATLREDLVPAELTRKTPADLAIVWPGWLLRRNAAIRARVAEGDEDSVVYFLLFGTTFTQQRRVTERELAALAVQPREALKSLQQRLTDFVTAMASPGANERLQFVRQVFMRHGIDPVTEEGQIQARRFLEERAPRVAATGLVRSSALLDPSSAAVDTLTLFRDRGLSSDTSIFIDYGIDETLDAIKRRGLIPPGTVRRAAVIGPGLDFTDKLEGYDFYPQQTIQPFAIIDSLTRHGLASPDLQITGFDVSPRIIQHLETARERARAGHSYPIVLPRNIDRPWTPDLVTYWTHAGDRIGEQGKALAPPPNAGRLDVRRVLVRPSVVLSMLPRDLNIVLERIEPRSADDQFDLIVATNILLYYEVFEQALAAANIAKMLRPGGVLLTNNRLFELPPIPLTGVGYTDVTYMTLPRIGETGDRIVWYQRQ